MKRSLLSILILLFIFSCADKQIKTVTQDSADLTEFEKFFTTFEKDLVKTADVIVQNELIKNLTHLQRMDFGGSKYYPLEREALTKMIRSLSSYNYSESVLMNNSGTIIYSMKEDKLFSKRADSYPKSLGPLFHHCKDGDPFILDVREYPEMQGREKLIFSIPVKRNGVIEGVLVAAIEETDIVKYVSLKSNVLDENGIVRLSTNSSELMIEDELFITLKNEPIGAASTRSYLFTPFQYRNLVWQIKTVK